MRRRWERLTKVKLILRRDLLQSLLCRRTNRRFRGSLYVGKRMRSVAYGLGRLSQRTQEAAAHPLPITEAGVAGDLLDRQTSLLEHESSGFEPKIFDGPGGRLARFRSEHAAELARTEPCSVGKLLHRQRLAK